MSCATGTCKSKCGEGKASPRENKGDPVFAALCQILCETRKEFCEGKHQGKNRGQVAEDKASKSQKLKDAIGAGKSPVINKERLVKYPNMPKSWGRSPLSPENLANQLDSMKKQLKAE